MRGWREGWRDMEDEEWVDGGRGGGTWEMKSERMEGGLGEHGR